MSDDDVRRAREAFDDWWKREGNSRSGSYPWLTEAGLAHVAWDAALAALTALSRASASPAALRLGGKPLVPNA